MRQKIAKDIENIDRYFPENAVLPDSKLYTSPQTAQKMRRKEFQVPKSSQNKTLTARGKDQIKQYNKA